MYAVKNWNEEVIKWLAVAMVLALVGMTVMPMAVGNCWAAAWTWDSGGDSDAIIDSAISSATGALLFSMLYYGWTCTPVSLGAVAASVAFSA